MKEFFYRVLAWVVFAIIFCPLLLLLTEGEKRRTDNLKYYRSCLSVASDNCFQTNNE